MRPSVRTVADFALTNAVHIAFSVILLSQVPLFTISSSSQLSQMQDGISRTTSIECYAFYARVVGPDGQTGCTNTEFGESCWNVIETLNLQHCFPANSSDHFHASVSPVFESYSMFAPVLMTSVVISCSVAPVLIGLSLFDIKYWGTAISISLFMFFVAGALSVGLVVVTAHIVDKASHQGNNGAGQHVFINAGTWVGITLPLLSLILGGTVSRWKTSKLD